MKELSFCPVIRPSPRGSGVHLKLLHPAGRGGTGIRRPSPGLLEVSPVGRRHFPPYSTCQSPAARLLWHASTQGHALSLGQPRERRRSTHIGERWLCPSHPHNGRCGCRCGERAVGKNQQAEWMSFLNENTDYFYVSILFKVILWAYNFDVQIHSSN